MLQPGTVSSEPLFKVGGSFLFFFVNVFEVAFLFSLVCIVFVLFFLLLHFYVILW